MNPLPHASAKGRNQSGIIAGKLNGVIAATTPTGWRICSTSTPLATPSRFSPFSRWGIAVAASTDSIPRPTSPRASSMVLPMSSVTRRASSSWCWNQLLAQAHDRPRAPLRGQISPGGLGLASSPDGGVDVGGSGERARAR